MSSISKKALHISGLAFICFFVAAPGACAPKGEDMTPGLKGIDADANGIRDDIDALIAQKYSDTPRIKIAAEDYARTVQGFMEAKTKQEAYDFANKSGHMIECIIDVAFPGNDIESYKKRSQLIDEVVAYTANTRERFEKYWKSSALISGSTFRSNLNPECP